MQWAWRIGRVRGIDIKVHVTFVLALAWGAFVLGWSGPAGRLYGAFLTLVLFVNVLLHELGHAVAAQRYGIRVEDIILLPIGGVARLHQLPARPRYELVIALAGPAVNLVLAILLLFITVPLLLLPGTLTPGGSLFLAMTEPGIAGVLICAWVTNVSPLVFNLIPAFPMDGRRVLRALLAYDYPCAPLRLRSRRPEHRLPAEPLRAAERNPGMNVAGLFVFFAARRRGAAVCSTSD